MRCWGVICGGRERGCVEVTAQVGGCLGIRAGKSKVGENPRVSVIEDSSQLLLVVVIVEHATAHTSKESFSNCKILERSGFILHSSHNSKALRWLVATRLCLGSSVLLVVKPSEQLFLDEDCSRSCDSSCYSM